MGLVTVTGNMATAFQRLVGQATIGAYKGTQSWPGSWVDAFIEDSDVEFVPVAFYNFTAGPTIQGAAYKKMKQDVLDSGARNRRVVLNDKRQHRVPRNQ